ncbi:hypothetical protein CspeluHIS016_0105590 [Cutaneotrichosporon spelunceum]|uniref:Pre-mRNA-splicing factor SLU7 n=1 Tax=Cutaneotrichosporon spelunceum TaxID=1672016 RepID=A0AAD3TNT5_9TREE|nr:hypothetical protein CspeluHIS016_0105590 [Cutaneotrichosporon spelunceum]
MQRLPAETSDRIATSAYRAKKQLAELTGKADDDDVNPHVPDFIAKAPWWADTGNGAAPNMAHQRKDTSLKSTINQWYDRGTAGPAATKYRKGACENCGAMTHKRKDCVERPRRRGAKFTGKNIAADETVQAVPRDFDAKRDRWNGYDPSTYKQVVDEYEAEEEARRAVREAELAEKKIEEKKKEKAEDDEFGSDDDEDDVPEAQYADQADQVGQKFDTKTRMTVRNLRIREDTAKYLLNLDPESAHYDPKTRAMRDAPEVGKKAEDLRFAGDNFDRYSGDATNMQRLQLFAWQSAQRGHNVNMHSNPTAGELLHREFNEKRNVLKDTTKQSILEKYGGEEHLERLPAELLGGQTEHYVEYSRTGQVIKGMEKAKARSKYQEDVYVNNHTSIWGSWFDRDSSAWGYACCHSLVAGSYCTGEAGKMANQASSAQALLDTKGEEEEEEEVPVKSLVELHRERMAKGEVVNKDKGKEKATSDFASYDDDPEAIALDKSRLKAAVAAEKKRKALGEEEAWEASKKAKQDVTKEELEAYRLSRQAFDDPMANYQDES